MVFCRPFLSSTALWLAGLVLAAGVCGAFGAYAAHAASSQVCEDTLDPGFLARYGEDLEGFWTSERPVEILSTDGQRTALTFSMDSEIPTKDVYRLILQNDVEFAGLTLKTRGLARLTVSQLAQMFSVSRRQVRLFVLRKGISSKAKTYGLTDLNPAYFERALGDEEYCQEFGIDTEELNQYLAQATEGILMRMGLPVSVGLDGNSIEVRHSSFEKVPRRFADLIQRLHIIFDRSQTHFHVGIPARIFFVANYDLAEAVAQAVEAKIVIGLLAQSPNQGALLAYAEGSPLALSDRRGVVKFEPSGFSSPQRSHNLEIRQWDDIGHALSLVAFATRMIKRARRIEEYKAVSFGFGLIDAYAGNVSGALEYAAFVLEKSREAKIKEIAARLRRLAQKASQLKKLDDRHYTMADSVRTEIFNFLNTNGVPRLLEDDELYFTRKD